LLVAGREVKGTNIAKFPTKGGRKIVLVFPKKKKKIHNVPPLVIMVLKWSMLKS